MREAESFRFQAKPLCFSRNHPTREAEPLRFQAEPSCFSRSYLTREAKSFCFFGNLLTSHAFIHARLLRTLGVTD